MAEEPTNRGDWAEEYVRNFLSLPLVSEFVFHSGERGERSQVSHCLSPLTVTQNLDHASIAWSMAP